MTKLIIRLIALVYFLVFSVFSDIRPIDTQTYSRLVRCSRRFYPGTCDDPVVSVWKYDAQRQNCTERLGCRRMSTDSNRFRSYILCMGICHPLMNLYTHVLLGDDIEPLNILRNRNPGQYPSQDMKKLVEEAYKEYQEDPDIFKPEETKDPDMVELEKMLPADFDVEI